MKQLDLPESTTTRAFSPTRNEDNARIRSRRGNTFAAQTLACWGTCFEVQTRNGEIWWYGEGAIALAEEECKACSSTAPGNYCPLGTLSSAGTACPSGKSCSGGQGPAPTLRSWLVFLLWCKQLHAVHYWQVFSFVGGECVHRVRRGHVFRSDWSLKALEL